ncbi:hypothetical protein AS25_03155 [Kocuria marina]|uniref:Uncharacterized protein n=1 Tax=Kocuria marina TaxID=223184 RepID=A0A0B0DBP9_9MICC|nr:hypothetical protein [Kocuria marina]KHE74833.1 hypothetical protein AS25_03155 [Kocuria marina]
MKRLPLEPRAYLWDPATDPHPGAILVRGQYIKVFIPHEELVRVADALIDIYEEQDREGVTEWASRKNQELSA